MIYGLQDVVRIRQMADESVASEAYKRHERQKLDTLLGWCEITACRRSPLLTYFGEPSIDSCGNCDNCQQPPLTRDGSKDAQKLLSAVYRSNQTFGAAHIVDILLGKLTPKVKQHSHNDLSVFGIGADKPQQTWRSVIRQLVVHGCLRADADRYGALVLTESARAILRGEESVELRIDADTPKKLRVSRQRQSAFDGHRCRHRYSRPPYVGSAARMPAAPRLGAWCAALCGLSRQHTQANAHQSTSRSGRYAQHQWRRSVKTRSLWRRVFSCTQRSWLTLLHKL